MEQEFDRESMYSAISMYIDGFMDEDFTHQYFPNRTELFMQALAAVKAYEIEYPSFYKTQALFVRLTLKMGTEGYFMN